MTPVAFSFNGVVLPIVDSLYEAKDDNNESKHHHINTESNNKIMPHAKRW